MSDITPEVVANAKRITKALHKKIVRTVPNTNEGPLPLPGVGYVKVGLVKSTGFIVPPYEMRAHVKGQYEIGDCDVFCAGKPNLIPAVFDRRNCFRVFSFIKESGGQGFIAFSYKECLPSNMTTHRPFLDHPASKLPYLGHTDVYASDHQAAINKVIDENGVLWDDPFAE